MDSVSIFLLLIAAIFLVGIAGELVFEKTGVPDVIWLIAVGILIGPVSGFAPRERLLEIAPYFGAFTLVVVLFDGGSELRLRELGRAAPRALLLAMLGFVFSAGVVAAVSMAAAGLGLLPESWSWMHGATLGAILGGSSSVVIMPTLRKAGLGSELSNLVNLESALTDVLCVVTTGACIELLVTGSRGVGQATTTLAKSFSIGLALGCAAGLLSLFVLRRLAQSAYAYPLVLGGLLILYVVVDEFGGSAALGILAMSILVGNAPALSRQIGLAKTAFLGRGVQDVHDQMTFIVKSFFFTFIGAMLAPPWGLLLLGAVLGVGLLAARVPATLLATAGSSFDAPSRKMISVFLPRGMAAGVLAMMPAHAGVKGTEQLPVVVFATVLTTIATFSIAFPLLKRRGARAAAMPELQQAQVDAPGSAPTAVPAAAEQPAVAGAGAVADPPQASAPGPAAATLAASELPPASDLGSSPPDGGLSPLAADPKPAADEPQARDATPK